MPQLNPAPWFFILVLSWVSFLLIFKTMILSSSIPNKTEATTYSMQQSLPWNWPWA